MADENTQPETGITPEGDVVDPRGEDLASELLPDGADYQIAPDETEAEELTDTEPGAPDEMIADAEQLEEAEVAAERAPSTRPRKKAKAVDTLEADPESSTAVATTSPLRPKRVPVKKDAPTPKARKGGAVAVRDKRVGPVQFVNECVDELRKVVWPTGEQLGQYFVVVLVFVLFIIALVSLLDLGFTSLLLKLLG